MTITVAQPQKKEIPIPYFFKLEYQGLEPTIYGILTEDKVMRIEPQKEITCMGIYAIQDTLINTRLEEINEAEFIEAFEKTAEHLTQMLPVTF